MRETLTLLTVGLMLLAGAAALEISRAIARARVRRRRRLLRLCSVVTGLPQAPLGDQT